MIPPTVFGMFYDREYLTGKWFERPESPAPEWRLSMTSLRYCIPRFHSGMNEDIPVIGYWGAP